jgi:membrane-associated protease RseP (regulator of RpoE activity)
LQPTTTSTFELIRVTILAAGPRSPNVGGQRWSLRLKPRPLGGLCLHWKSKFLLPLFLIVLLACGANDSEQRTSPSTAIEPVYTEGKVAGLHLDELPPGSPLAEAGLISGDVIIGINGTSVDSFDASALAAALADADQLAIRVRSPNGSERNVSITPP